MRLLGRFRFTMASVMMMVVTAAAASALFAKVHDHVPATSMPYFKVDAPVVFVASVLLTAAALGALKSHTPGQMMLQMVLACLGLLFLFTLAENHWNRPMLYWSQASFALLVTGPLLARRSIKAEMERGPRRTWWKRTCEAHVFAFVTMMLVAIGALLQWLFALIAFQVLKL